MQTATPVSVDPNRPVNHLNLVRAWQGVCSFPPKITNVPHYAVHTSQAPGAGSKVATYNYIRLSARSILIMHTHAGNYHKTDSGVDLIPRFNFSHSLVSRSLNPNLWHRPLSAEEREPGAPTRRERGGRNLDAAF